MTDPKWESDPRDQEQAVERRPRSQDPTAVDHTRESDASTITSNGLTGGRPAGPARVTPERDKLENPDRADEGVSRAESEDPDRPAEGPLTRVDI